MKGFDMKLLKKTGFQGSRSVWLGCAAAAWLCLAAAPAFAAEAVETQPANVLPWISDVVKMNDAGVPPDLLANYVKNSPARSSLSADDIIYLKNHGVSTPIITAMIEHGAMAPSAYVAQAPQPAPVYAQPQPQMVYQQPAADQQPVTVYNDYGDYSYPQYDYPYYPYYYGYNYPTWYFPYYYTYGFAGRVGFRGGFRGNFGRIGRAGFPGVGFHGGGIGGFHGIASAHVGGIGHEGGRR
jgi:hypothetical protein